MARDLSLDISADPDEFEEAVAEFASRRVISRKEADKLENYAKRHAWWISGVAQMDIVNDAHRSILEAMRSGIPFEEWQKEIGPKLEAAWGRRDSARILTIFRNATTQAYNAGRWEQMNEPHVKAMRPYVEYDVVDDQRTTEHICRPLIGVVLPIDDPFVLTHNPPLHHRCRTGLRSKRASYVERRGVTKDPPDVEVTPGFGYPPNLAEPPKPQKRKVLPDPEIEREMLRKASHDAHERKPVKIPQNPKHTPEYWEEHYREKYGEAAAQVAWGRMVHERAKELDLREAVRILDGLSEAKVPGVTPGDRHFLKVALGEEQAPYGINANAVDAARIMAQHAKLCGRRNVPAVAAPKEFEYLVDRNQAFWERMSASKRKLPEGVKVAHLPADDYRSTYTPSLNQLNLYDGVPVGTVVHEYGHAVEYNSDALAAAQAFLLARTRGEPFKKLSEFDEFYDPSELTRPDKFYDAYIGKHYRGYATEVISTVVGHIAEGRMWEILLEDPETLYFVLGILAGA